MNHIYIRYFRTVKNSDKLYGEILTFAYNNIVSHLDRDRYQTGQQDSLLTHLSMDKTREGMIETP